MATKTAIDYIVENDFEGAKAKFDKANARWKKHWFDTCVRIAEKVKEWATKYLFDPVALTIVEIVRKVKKAISKKNGESYVYLIKMFDDCDSYVFLKAGKANDLKERFNTLGKELYKRSNTQIERLEVLSTWKLPDSHLAEAFEQTIHSYLSKLFIHIPNDRYEPVELNETHFAELNRRYELMAAFF